MYPSDPGSSSDHEGDEVLMMKTLDSLWHPDHDDEDDTLLAHLAQCFHIQITKAHVYTALPSLISMRIYTPQSTTPLHRRTTALTMRGKITSFQDTLMTPLFKTRPEFVQTLTTEVVRELNLINSIPTVTTASTPKAQEGVAARLRDFREEWLLHLTEESSSSSEEKWSTTDENTPTKSPWLPDKGKLVIEENSDIIPDVPDDELRTYFTRKHTQGATDMVHPRLPIEDEFIKLNISCGDSEPRYINVSANIPVDQLPTFQELFREYRDIFAYTYKELLGAPTRCQHRIPLREGSRFMDGFNGYNQIGIAPEDQYKTTFVMQWSTFVYRVMPFGLQNAPATFQRYMMNSFLPLSDQLKLYLDDLCAHGPRGTHIATLRATFKACRKAKISLNPDKCFFGASYGPLLGLLVSRAGTSINPRKIECILQIPIPETVRDIHLSTGKTKTFHLNALDFTVMSGTFYRMGPDHVLRRVLDTEEIPVVLKSCHFDEAGGHFSGELTARKIYLAGYWWSTVHKDCDNYVKRCNACQRQSRQVSRYAALLSPMLVARPFQKWGIDFIGPINQPSRNTRHKYIIVATDYVTKWAEAASFTRARGSITIQFLHHNIISRFGVPITIITDNGTHFLNDAVEELAEAYGIEHRRSTPYHPQTNGQVERTNGILVNVLKKTVALNPTDWDRKLIGAIWAYRTTYKVITGHTPFQLVYGQEAILPVEFSIPTLRVLTSYHPPGTSDLIEGGHPPVDPLTERVHSLYQLTEKHIQALYTQYVIQAMRKQQFDQKVKHKDIRKNDLVLKYNNRISRFPAKFATQWLGLYLVQEVFDNGTIQLSTLQEEFLPAKTNVEKIRLYNPHYILEIVPVTRVPADRERSVFHISTFIEPHGELITTEAPRRKKLKIRRASHGRRSLRKRGETTTTVKTHGHDNRDATLRDNSGTSIHDNCDATLRDNRGKSIQDDRDMLDQRKRKTREITDIHTVGCRQLQKSGGNNCHADIERTHAQIGLHIVGRQLTNDLLLQGIPITRKKCRYKPVTSSDEELFRERKQQNVELSSSRSHISASLQSVVIVPREQTGRTNDCEGAIDCFVVDMVDPKTIGKRRRGGTVPVNPGVYFARPSLYDLRNLAEGTKTIVRNSGLWHFLSRKHKLPTFDENALEEWLATIEAPTDDTIRLMHPTQTGLLVVIDASVIRRVFLLP
ncbi:hypothetical protein R1sor_009048 [Riccia sorocarpa]|uniref:Integrase catalytic domain-containing protein n=1 Tax=Riccia sorocarpa TaxID=122646 RepID=A0ABD3H7H1_9MARC